MLRSIEIEGYKCFKNSKFEGFKRVNLITGLNNSGKSCLLEAIFLAQSPFYSTLQLINYFRSMPPRDISDVYLQNFFFQRDSEKQLHIVGQFEKGNVDIQLNLHKTFHKPKSTNLMGFEMIGEPTSIYGFPKDILDGHVSFFDEIMKFQRVTKQESKKASISRFVAQTENPTIGVIFFPAKAIVNKISLAKKFKQIVEMGLKQKFQKLISAVFNSIGEIELHGEELMVLSTENVYRSLASYGDASLNYCTFLIELFNLTAENRYILIDEFENGFHYTTHKEVWKSIIQLCVTNHVQLFATTHSKEFVLAYSEAVQELELESECGFFEIYQRPIPKDIAMHSWDVLRLPEYFEENIKIRGEA